jgi:hypothetical protein
MNDTDKNDKKLVKPSSIVDYFGKPYPKRKTLWGKWKAIARKSKIILGSFIALIATIASLIGYFHTIRDFKNEIWIEPTLKERKNESEDSLLASVNNLGLMFEKMKFNIDNIIDDAKKEADFISFRYGVETVYKLNSFIKVNPDIKDKKFDELEEPQKQTFNKIKVLVSLLNSSSGRGHKIEDLERLLNEISLSISEMNPFGIPTILNISPILIPPSSDGNAILIKIYGLNINISNPEISINNRSLKNVITKRNYAEFELPNSFVHTVPIKYTIIESKIALNAIDSINESVNIIHPFMVLPSKLGSAKISIIYSGNKKIQTKDRSSKFWVSTGDLTKYKCDKKSYKPQSGFLIDLESLKVTVDKKQASTKYGFKSKSSNAFEFQACAKSELSLFNKKNGIIGCTIKWQEYNIDDSDENVDKYEYDIYFGKMITHKLNRESVGKVILDIVLFNGEKFKYELPTNNLYINAIWNKDNENITIIPLDKKDTI